MRSQDHAAEDGKLLIAYENQGVYSWSTEPNAVDPPVYGRWEADEPWTLDVPSLSMFLIQFFLFEASITARFAASASWLSAAELQKLTRATAALPMPEWHWPAFPTSFHVRGGAIVVAAPNDDQWSVWVGGKTAQDLAFLSEHLSDSWEHVDLRGEAG